MIALGVILVGALTVSVRSRSRSHGGYGDDPAQVELVVRQQLYGRSGLKASRARPEVSGGGADAGAQGLRAEAVRPQPEAAGEALAAHATSKDASSGLAA